MSAIDRYCEVIYELAEDDIDVLQVRIAERLGVSRPAVSEMTARLVADGLLDSAGGRLAFTDLGLRTAETAVRRHRLAERLLVDVLGLGWAEAHDLAGTWQSVIDDRTEPALVRLLGDPTTCPHGNPIPRVAGSEHGSVAALAGDVIPLSDVAVGSVAHVVRVTERLENVPGMLTSLEHAGLVPGTRVEVLSASSDGSIAVRASRDVTSLTAQTAASILVGVGDLARVVTQVSRLVNSLH
jgi:DtxR family transcriptional regulator, Mn-dependent transcriptional regulator